jgi:hypothetical protein
VMPSPDALRAGKWDGSAVKKRKALNVWTLRLNKLESGEMLSHWGFLCLSNWAAICMKARVVDKSKPNALNAAALSFFRR